MSQAIGDGDAKVSVSRDREYLNQVMAEIDEEVRRKRASGDLPARLEHELDELFLEHSPVAGRGGALHEALRMVDGAAFIDPVVPVESNKSGGAAVKKGLRSLNLWYIGYVTQQVSQFASAVSRSLHLLEQQLETLRRRQEEQTVPPAPVVEVRELHRADAWWIADAGGALLQGVPGRVLHAACGDGWLVRALGGEGFDAYGVDPRAGATLTGGAGHEAEDLDLREEDLGGHLRSVEPAALGGVVLSGVVDGMTGGQRDQLLRLVSEHLSPGGRLVVHSLSPAGWANDEVPVEADFAAGHPLRSRTWPYLLHNHGFDATVREGPAGDDYVVIGVLRERVVHPEAAEQ